MRQPRVVLVSRRFWPLLGGAEIAMSNLARGLREAGADVTLLTAKWDPSWSADVVHHGVPVVRLAQPRQRFWGTWKYLRGLDRWLTERRGEIDLVYVSMLKQDAYAAIGAGRRGGFPVALRAEGAGITGDVHWQLDAPFGRRIRQRCYRAAAVVAPSTAIENELIAAGYPRHKLHPIANAVRIPALRTPEARHDARASLAETHPLLGMSAAAPIAVFTGRLHPLKGLDTLIEAWRLVAACRPDARLWIVGDGPERAKLWRQIDEAGLDGRVVLAGAFDSVDDFLAAADLFVLPSLEEGMSLSLLEAMAAGLPVVATDIAGNRAVVDHEAQGLLVPTGQPAALAGAINCLLDDADLGQRLGSAARARVAREFALESMVQTHLALFERLIRESKS